MSEAFEMVITIKVPAGKRPDFDDQTFSLYDRLCEIKGCEFETRVRSGPGKRWKTYDTAESFREAIAESEDD